MTAKKPKGIVRVATFEVKVPSDLRAEINSVSLIIAQCCNLFFQRWREYHQSNGNFDRVHEASRLWNELETEIDQMGKKKKRKVSKEELGPGGRFGIDGKAETIVPQSLMNSVLHECQGKYNVTQRCISLAIRKVAKLLNGKSAAVNMPQWWAIMMFRQSAPSYLGNLSIPFDKHGSHGVKLIAPETNDANWVLSVNSPMGGSRWNIPILSSKRKTKKQVIHLARILNNTYEAKGISLIERDRKWFVAVGYQKTEAEHVAVDLNKQAFLAPGETCPWMLAIEGEDFVRNRFASNGEFLAHQRQSLISQEKSRKTAGYYHGSGSKSHGRVRAVRGLIGPKKKWSGVIQSFNRVVAKKVFDICISRGVGKLTLLRPDPASDSGDNTFLASAGTEQDSSWCRFEWTTFCSYLSQKCHGVIVFEDVKTSELLSEQNLIHKASHPC